MKTATEQMAEGLSARLAELGGQPVADGRGVLFEINGRTAAASLPDPAEVNVEAAFSATARALMAVGTFADAAGAVLADVRRSEVAKSEDTAALARTAAETIRRELDAAGAEVERARLAVGRVVEAAPVPRAADAVAAIADVEKRGMVRALALPQSMRAIEGDRALCLAVLREPAGFPEPLIQHAREVWSRFEPGAPMTGPAEVTLRAWEGARTAIGAAAAALERLSAGRSRLAAVA